MITYSLSLQPLLIGAKWLKENSRKFRESCQNHSCLGGVKQTALRLRQLAYQDIGVSECNFYS